jgi:pimeloyl-ACP methyl ester carboxylesterase
VALGEWAAALQVPRLVLRSPWLATAPRGDGAPVLVLPGRGVADISTAPLRRYLGFLGHRTRGWGLGVNDGNLDRLLPLVAPAVAALADRHGRPVSLVGQSLGGFVAREAARRHPDLVARVITLGTPIFAPRSGRSLTVPVTAVWSPQDRVVPPARAIDRDPVTENVEVASTHFGMGIDPDVWRIVARRLGPSDDGTGGRPGRAGS